MAKRKPRVKITADSVANDYVDAADVAGTDHATYMAKAEKAGCPVLDIATLLLEGLQAWRHGGHVKTKPHK